MEFIGGSEDEYGEELLGWYWQFIDPEGLPTTGLMGPYGTAAEAEAASQRALDSNNY